MSVQPQAAVSGSLTVGAVDRPSETAMICDVGDSIEAAFTPDLGVDPRHNDGVNYACVDGHCQWKRTNQVSISLQ